MKNITWGLVFLLIGCAGFGTRDSLFPRRYSGDFDFQNEEKYFRAHYENGILNGELIAGKRGSFELRTHYQNGKEFGKQTVEAADGKVAIQNIDTLKINSASKEPPIDQNGNPWVIESNFKSNGKTYQKKENRYYNTIEINEMRDTLIDGTALILNQNGDTLCRDIYVNGKQSKMDPGCHRSTEEILAVVRKNIPSLKSAYDKRLKSSGFRAKIYVRFQIGADGKTKFIYAEKILCKNVDFVHEILSSISTWEYKKENSPYPDVVSFPISFME